MPYFEGQLTHFRLEYFDNFCIFGILMYDIVLKISFLELFEHFYFWALLESPENFDGLDAKLNVLENFQKKFWWMLLTQIIQKCQGSIEFFTLGELAIFGTP